MKPKVKRRFPGGRTPIVRVFQIDAAIRAGLHPNCSGLALELEVSPKTVQRDIEFMRDSLCLPIEYRGAKYGYEYEQSALELHTILAKCFDPEVAVQDASTALLVLVRRVTGRLRSYQSWPRGVREKVKRGILAQMRRWPSGLLTDAGVRLEPLAEDPAGQS